MPKLDSVCLSFSQDPIPRAISRQSSMHSLHNTYYNPAFPAPSPPRPTSRTSEIIDKNSLKYLDQEEGVGAWDNTTAPLPTKMDSGMVSLVSSIYHFLSVLVFSLNFLYFVIILH